MRGCGGGCGVDVVSGVGLWDEIGIWMMTVEAVKAG